ncbi:50S ribosomal protein L18 [Patescibacteria group bacterium]|nr:50S ribosomal protein L18 [Patescibacteria group bacterium]MBU2579750.1 50S ribosomal protein L18 [Patescibacteria group bacterium]
MMTKQDQRNKRHKRVRGKVIGIEKCPRLSVFRSNKYINLQLINDETGKTMASFNDLKINKKGKTKIEAAKEAGIALAKKANEQKIEKVVFDRGGYKYHGRVKAAAEGAREGGLKF